MKKLTGIVIGLAFVLCAFSAQARAQAQTCENSTQCDDGVFCNGIEVCVQSNPPAQSTCEPGTDPCGGGTPVCDEDNDRCVECLTDDNCTDGVCSDNICVECVDNADCPEDGDPCNGEEICDENTCESAGNPCQPGDICIPLAPPDYICMGCVSDDNCTDDLFCNGDEYCMNDGACRSPGDPCDPASWNSLPATTLPLPVCDEQGNQCVECLVDDNCTDGAEPYCVDNICVACRNNADCDNGTFCDGAEECDNGTCYPGEPPCQQGDLVLCDEDNATCVECYDNGDCEGDNGTPLCDGVMCVECLVNQDCDNGTFCVEGVCAQDACDLIIKPSQVRINKKFRPVQRQFRIRGGEGFDPYAEIDFGLFKVRRATVTKKGVLKVLVTIPANAIPNKGPYEMRVGNCVGTVLLR